MVHQVGTAPKVTTVHQVALAHRAGTSVADKAIVVRTKTLVKAAAMAKLAVTNSKAVLRIKATLALKETTARVGTVNRTTSVNLVLRGAEADRQVSTTRANNRAQVKGTNVLRTTRTKSHLAKVLVLLVTSSLVTAEINRTNIRPYN